MKTVVFLNTYEYCEFMCYDIASCENVSLIKPVRLKNIGWIGVLMFLLKRISFRLYNVMLERVMLSKLRLSKDEKICFISFDSSYQTANKTFVYRLRKKYPNSYHVLIVYNAINGQHACADKYSSIFDTVFTFDPYDAALYNWNYFHGLLPESQPNDENDSKHYDVVFIGADKGRYDFLKNAYILLREKEMNCLFYIISDKEPVDDIDKILLHKNGMPFQETIDIEKKTRCILDYSIVNDGMQGLSLRILESVYCKALLATNNKYVEHIPGLYKNAFVFSDCSELNDIRTFLDTQFTDFDTAIFSANDLLHRVHLLADK